MKPRKTDYGTIILHWLLVAAVGVAFVTGLRIATEAPDRAWLNAIDVLLPRSGVWTSHMEAAIVLVAVSNQDSVSFYSDARLTELLDVRFSHKLDGARKELVTRDSCPREHTSPSSSSRPPVRRVQPHAASDLESVKQLLERLGRGPR